MTTINLYNAANDHFQTKVKANSVDIHVNTLPMSLKASTISIENVSGNSVVDLVETVLDTIQSVSDETTNRIAEDSTLQTAIDTNATNLTNFIATKGTGICPLVSGIIPTEFIPPISISTPTVYASIATRDADTVEVGDVAIVIDVGKSYVYSGTNYVELITTGNIASINGKTGGSVVIDTSEINESGDSRYYTAARDLLKVDVSGSIIYQIYKLKIQHYSQISTLRRQTV